MEPRPAITFSNETGEMMRITEDGRFFVRGREVETDTQVRDALAAFAVIFTEEHQQAAVRLEQAANGALAHLEGRRHVFSTWDVSTVVAVLRQALGPRVDEERGKPWTFPTQDPSPN